MSQAQNYFVLEINGGISLFSKCYLLEKRTKFAILCINLLDENGQTPLKIDCDRDPQKHHTIPSDVLPTVSEDFVGSFRVLSLWLNNGLSETSKDHA